MMKNLRLILQGSLLLLIFSNTSISQVVVTVTGNTNTSPNLAASYTSLNDALNALNSVTSMTGAVTLTCNAGSETAPSSSGFTLGSATLNPVLSSTNTVSILAAGVVTLNAAVGVSTPSSATPDGIFKIVGADYVTIDGITFNDGNTTNPASMEFGLALFKAGVADGSQNNTISNCIFNMDRNNFASGTSPMVEGSVGILMINSTPSAATTVLTPTVAAGTNSFNKIYGNTTNGGNYGIVLSGFAASTPFTLGDTSNDIGGSSVSTGNTVLNFGGGTASTNASAGIRANNQWSINISYNTINNNNGSGVNHTSTLRGIYAQAGTSANATINFNTITVSSAATTSVCYGIENAIGATAASNTININNNTIQNCTYATATTGIIRGIFSNTSATNVNILNNTISGLSQAGSGQFDAVGIALSPVNLNVSFNTIDNCTKTGTGNLHGIYASSSPTNITYRGNAVSNLSVTGASGTIYGLRASTSLLTIFSNQLSSFSINNTSGATASNIYGIFDGASPTQENIFLNTINNLDINGATTSTACIISGINLNTLASSNKQIYSNEISDFLFNNSSTGAVTITGISQLLGNSVDLYSNKIYDLVATAGAGSLTRGIQIGSGTTLNVYNNLIGNLQASASTSGDAVRGISISSTTTSSNLNISFNTISINGTSSGTGFGSQGIFHTYSATGSTASLIMRNNIIVNTSTATGTGATCAFRRSASTDLNNYNVLSNNNLFYAGVPSASNLIYSDGTNNDQTLAAFKARVAPRESVSISENPNFVSSTGSSSDFLHINTAIATQIESGGVAIAGITSDFDGDTRNVSTPDMGADEFSGIGIDLSAPAITYTTLANTGCLVGTALSNVTISDATGVNITAGTRPRMYYKKTTNANTYADNTNATDGWKYVEASGVGSSPFTFTFDFTLLSGGGGIAIGDTIQYFVVAQDIVMTPNVGINSGAPATPPTSVALTAAQFPVTGTINRFVFINTLSGTKTIGASGDYPTLTGTGGFFEAVNNLGVSANVVANIIDATVTETGTVALNSVAYTGCTAGPFTVTIKPNTSSIITGSVGTGSIIKLNGADNIIIDGSNSGGTDRNLTIRNTTATSSGNAVVWIASPALGNGSNNNVVKNCIIEGNSQSTTFMGIYLGGNTSISLTAAGSEKNNSNTFQNNLFRKTQYGLALFGYAANSPDENNIITGNNFGTAVAGEGLNLFGINADRQLNLIVSNNEVQNVTNSTSTSTFGGIRLLDFKNGLAYNNNVHDISYTGASTPKVYGIIVTSSTYTTSGNPSNATVYNNFISKINSTGISTVWNATGLLASAGYGDKFYHNTVHMTGQLAASSSGLVAAFANGDANITSVCSNIDVRNNIFNLEGSSSVAGGNFWAWYTQGTSFTGSQSNYNLLRCAGTGVTNNIGRFNAVNYPTLVNWQTATGQDANSFSDTPTFTSTTDLHINTGMSSTRIESGGTTLTINTDIDGQTRPGPTGSVNGGATSPDVGADEFDGVPAVPMTVTSSTVEQITGSAFAGVTNQAIIRVKIVTSGPLSPLSLSSLTLNANGTTAIGDINATPARVYYTGSSTTFSTGTLFGSATPTIADFTVNGSQVLAEGNNYFWVAYDLIPTAMTGNLIDGECNSINVGSAIVPSVTAPAGNKVVLGPMNGTYLVGTGQTTPNFPTLTTAITDLNFRGIVGAVTFELLDPLYSVNETFPLVIQQITGASSVNTITFRPSSGVATTISGSTATLEALIKLNGSDYVTFNGNNGPGSSLTIENTSTSVATAAIWIASTGAGAGATNNSILNCNLKAGVSQNTATTNTYGIILAGATLNSTHTSIAAGDDNDNNIFSGNTITKVRYGIVTRGGATTNPNLNTQITNNIIGSASFGANEVGKCGVNVREEDGIIISGNTIQSVGGDFANTSAGADRVGIALSTDGSWTPTATYIKNAIITNNKIFNVVEERTFSAVGIAIGAADGTNATNNLIANNMIGGIKANGTSGDQAVGIGTSASNSDKIVFNTIQMSGDTDPNASATTPSVSNFGISISSTSVTNPTIANNIVVMDLTSSSASSIANACINVPAAYAWGTGFSNYNDLYINPANTQSRTGCVGGSGGTFHLALADWQTAVTQDANSLAVSPNFSSASDLHLVPETNVALNNFGTPIVGVTLDIDNETRNATTPDMGCDEITPIVCSGQPNAGTISPSLASVCVGNTYAIAATGLSTGIGISYQWKSGPSGGPYTNVMGGSGSNTNTYTTPALPIGSYYYIIETTCSISGQTNQSNEVTLTINPKPTAIISPAGPTNICQDQTQTFTASSDIGNSYAWKRNNAIIGGATSSTYGATLSGDYKVIVSIMATGCSDSSAVSTLVVNPKPSTITLSPSSVSSCEQTIVPLMASGGTLGGNVTIGTATTLTGATTQPTAFCNRWTQYWCQMVYPASELVSAGLQAGNLNSVTFTITTLGDGTNVTDFEIYLGTAPGTTLSSFTTTGLTKVYGPATYNHAIGANTITFDIPYAWDGVSDLLLDIRQNGADAINNAITFFTATSGNTVVTATTSSASPDITTTSPTPVTSTQRLNTIFNYTTNVNKLWSPALGLFTDMAATIPYSGENLNTVYAKPSSTTNYTVTATSAAGCTSSASVNLEVTGDEVMNENNAGTGSLRKAIECTAAGDTVFVSSGSVNLINLLTQLNIDKPLLILDNNGSPVMLKFDFGGAGLMNETNGAFKVGTMGNVTLDNIQIKHVGNDATHPVVKNEGILTLKNSKITGETGNTIPPVVQNAAGATINAEGTSEIKSE